MPTPAPAATIIARGITIERADRPVLTDVDVTVTSTSRLAVVGPNGVGKSTLFQVLARLIRPDRGTVTHAPPDATVGLLHQELDRTLAPTVRDLVAERVGVAEATRRFEAATEALAAGGPGAEDDYACALDHWMSIGAADFDARLDAAADDVGLAAPLLDRHPVGLSGGEASRVGLLSVMLSRFDITLLDEPTNDLDIAGLHLLEDWVQLHSGGLAIVSHDRSFLERTVTSVLEIDEHDHTARLFHGGWQAFLDERATARAHAEQRYTQYVDERARLSARAQQQREWAERGVSNAKKRPADGDKFRRNWALDQTEKLVGKAKQTQRAIDRLEEVERPWQGWDLRFTVADAPRSASVVAALDGAVLERGNFRIGPLDIEVRWADRVALSGANGAGKSTVIGALLGRLQPVHGRASLGAGVIVGELDQRRASFTTGSHTLLRAFEDASGLTVSEARSVLAKFGLDTDAVGRSATSLSPGERTRAQLALFQARGVNFLVLDEPTNHLDLPAIEQLESALAGYTGTLLVVSHDRRLLETVEFTHHIELSEGLATVRT